MSIWTELKNNPRLKEIYEKRLKILRLTREFFWSQGFTEADTPIAVKYPGQEPYLNPMPVQVSDPAGQSHIFYLQTSPELAMKKLLGAGLSKIFQICKCFRNEESFGGLHNPEFTMIEWYRAPGDYREIMEDTEKLFKFVARELKTGFVQYRGNKIRVDSDWDRISMKEVWQKHAGINLDDYLTVEKMAGLAQVKGYQANADDAYEDLFYKIFLNEIEPKLGLEQPVFVYDYPAQMCSLSRLAKDPCYGERFELYIGGLELANAFGELTDSVEQARRLEIDKATRVRLGKPTWPVDQDFIDALKNVPSAGGIALGLDRMILLFTGAKDLNEVIFQAVADQINL